VARDLLVAADEHQQLNASDHCLYGVLPDIVCAIEGITEEIGFLHFAMTEKIIVTGRRRALSAVRALRDALRGGYKIATPAALLEAITGYMIASIDRFADDVAALKNTFSPTRWARVVSYWDAFDGRPFVCIGSL
jgi:zinc transporter